MKSWCRRGAERSCGNAEGSVLYRVEEGGNRGGGLIIYNTRVFEFGADEGEVKLKKEVAIGSPGLA